MTKLIYAMARLSAVLSSFLLVVGCGDIKRQLEDHENRISYLEEICQEFNTNISSLQTLVYAMQEKDLITSVVPVKKGTEVIGYTITFTKSEPITIYHGKDGLSGADGHSPKMGVRQDVDGVFYWTMDGEWLLDDGGGKVRAEGSQGLTPELKVEDGWWYVRYGLAEWTRLGQATGNDGKDGDSFFREVQVKGHEVTFVLASGEKLVLLRKVDGAVAIDPVVVSATTATFTGMLLVDSTPDFEFGILYSLTDDVLVQTSTLVTTYKLDAENRFMLVVKGLMPDTKYFYRTYTCSNGQKDYGEVLSFSTVKMLDAYDLSAAGSANCFIVPRAGAYKFKAVRGNSTQPIDGAVSACVLWETDGTADPQKVGSLISPNVTYADGYVTFMTAGSYKEGNAGVAVKDAQGNILWSWHLWLTDMPASHVYANGAGVLMDRNLGATSSERKSMGTIGMMYQWGRKDPFLGAAGPRAQSGAAATGDWPLPAFSDEECGTIAYSIAHPTTLIHYNDKNQDWVYTGDASLSYDRWTAEKTIYDPCPAGWRIPEGGISTDPSGNPVDALGKPVVLPSPSEPSVDPVMAGNFWVKAGFEGYKGRFDQNYRGRLFPAELSGTEAWYPTPGFVLSYNGDIGDFSSNGYYMTTATDGPRSRCMALCRDFIDELVLRGHLLRSMCGSVRCMKIEEKPSVNPVLEY